MKKQILFIILSFLPFIVYAQELNPGGQTQSHMGDKNIMVDHCTGIFHYRVPLYTIESGTFRLPITLDYTGRGVRFEENTNETLWPGWNLNTGGVVTRMVRGGITDENPTFGYLWLPRFSEPVTREEIKSVNKRLRDGESDIFTAVFNGETLHFILESEGDYKIRAVPLEQTNVQINCLFSRNDNIIEGWIITDEHGNRYIYKQKEWTVDIFKNDAVSFNDFWDESWISSWYLSRIELQNGEPIIFNYAEDVKIDGEQKGINIYQYSTTYKSTYFYGYLMRDWVFDFSQYSQNFKNEIRAAASYMNDYSMIEQIRFYLDKYLNYRSDVLNPDIEDDLWIIDRKLRIMGQMADFRGVGEILNRLLDMLDNLIDAYKFGNFDAVSHLQNAKEYLLQSIQELHYDEIKERETSSAMTYNVRSPMLKTIFCSGKFITFDYLERKATAPSCIKLENVSGTPISKIKLYALNNLSRIDFLDRDSNVVSRLKFDYYRNSDPYTSLFKDIWGYSRKGIEGDEYFPIVDQYSKIGSLKTITTADGGEITIDYESNNVGYRWLSRMLDFKSYDKYNSGQVGGIRIKSLCLHDDQNGVYDRIYYNYPQPGRFVYNYCSNRDTFMFAAFEDHIEHTRMKYGGTAFLKTGNNGVYYPYVEEIVQGKGIKSFLFNVPSVRYGHPPFLGGVYDFWMAGLPLATAMYDTRGNLKQITRYTYMGDRRFSPETPEEYFCKENIAPLYSNSLPQIKTYEYYLDGENLEEFYKAQGDILLGTDRSHSGKCKSHSYYFNPYSDVFCPNFLIRTRHQLPQQAYLLQYGGKVLLKEETEYRFENHMTNAPSVLDFSRYTQGSPFKRIRYFYDNLEKSLYPTRLSITDAKGDVYTTVVKRVTEIDDAASPVIAEMKWRNILSPVIKEIRLKGDKFLSEKVSFFQKYGSGKTSGIVLSSEYEYSPSSLLISPPHSFSDSRLFTWGKDNYRLCKSIDYFSENMSYLPSVFKTNSETCSICYDFNYNQVILKAYFSDSYSVAAVDLKKYREFSKPSHNTLRFSDNYTININRFYTPPASMEVTSIPLSRKLNLYVVSNKSHGIEYSVKHAKGLTRKRIDVNSTPAYCVQIFDLDLSEYRGIISVRVETSDMAFMALVPEHTLFEAVSYNTDGSVFCKFDHSGMLERYEYDAAGRIVRKYDGEGNILEENIYNRILP